MPHFIIEYSANLDAQVDIDALVRTVHEAAIETQIFPLKGTRTRACPRDRYLIADGDPDNAFVHITGFIGAGRDTAVRQAAAESIFARVCESLEAYGEHHPLALSFDLQEMAPETSLKQNNLPQWLARREGARKS